MDHDTSRREQCLSTRYIHTYVAFETLEGIGPLHLLKLRPRVDMALLLLPNADHPLGAFCLAVPGLHWASPLLQLGGRERGPRGWSAPKLARLT